jgi:tRNA pseudouridine55 synthase
MMLEKVSSLNRNVFGLLLLDKPKGLTSNAALQSVKRLFRAKKAGHTGSLDPLASGMLPICFGGGTKFSRFLLEADKTYRVTMKLGVRTDTSDAEGKVIATQPVPKLHQHQIQAVFEKFLGEVWQVPSMFSAIKHQGKPLYTFARRGIVVERQKRAIQVHKLSLIQFENNRVDFLVHCSKGTYIRTLVDDMGQVIKTGAHVIELRRLTVGHFLESQMVSFQDLKFALDQQDFEQFAKFLLPIDTIFPAFKSVYLTSKMAFCIKQGGSIKVTQSVLPGYVKLYLSNHAFLGIGKVLDNGQVIAEQLINNNK